MHAQQEPFQVVVSVLTHLKSDWMGVLLDKSHVHLNKLTLRDWTKFLGKLCNVTFLLTAGTATIMEGFYTIIMKLVSL